LEGLPGFNKESFLSVHHSGSQVTSVRVNPARPGFVAEAIAQAHFSGLQQVPWSRWGWYLPQRPSFTFDPLFHAGCYYVQEASSMFLEQALKQLAPLSQPLKVLDLSAAPGGKSTHLQSLLSPESLLVSNEVIRARCLTLIDNIVKWGAGNVVVTNNDPSHFKKLPGYFDVMVVDAPCSGSGLFRKDPGAIDEWSLNNVALCSQRQQRILADALSALKEGGVLIYSTCSYSREEDESIGEWLVQEMGLEGERLQVDPGWGIVESESGGGWGYRFYPDKVGGEGFYLSCFRKVAGEGEVKRKGQRLDSVTVRETAILQPWLAQPNFTFTRHGDKITAIPQHLLEDLSVLVGALNVQYKGVLMGAIMKERLVPEHALALSTTLSESVLDTPLDYAEAIRYLQRADLSVTPLNRGWQTVSFEGQRLGWINALPNRINNYYPKESRILKQQRDSGFEK
jgi:16S rRNA C967 or C1407 C5-methylase (RsmB/RsmF family)/NOL1/NOP2/fmu family ribosome biogenesis protein